MGGHARAEHAPGPIGERLRGVPEDLPPLVDEAKRHIGRGERERLDGLDDHRRFARGRLQEPPAGRRIEEEVLHGDRGPHGAARGPVGRLRASLDRDPGRLAITHAGHHLDARDGRDARQGFPAEPVRVDPLEVFRGADLAGGEPLEREWELVGGDPLAVIGDADEPASRAHELNRDPPRAGIEAVLDQLLHH